MVIPFILETPTGVYCPAQLSFCLKFHKVTIDLEAGRVHIKDKALCAALIKTKAGLARVD